MVREHGRGRVGRAHQVGGRRDVEVEEGLEWPRHRPLWFDIRLLAWVVREYARDVLQRTAVTNASHLMPGK